MRMSAALLAFAALICATAPAQAYLDPGTGSIILQAIVATVASSLFVIKMYWRKLKSLLGMTRSEASDDEAGSAS